MSVIYFDNAATSWPKPSSVPDAIARHFSEAGGNPGRSGHRMSIAAARIVEEARDLVAEVLHVSDPGQIVLTKNTSEGLCIAIYGMLRPGDHAITTSIEHNSVMRPLRHLETQGVELTVVPCRRDGVVDPDAVREAIRSNTRLLAAVHGSNVMGTLLPIGKLASIAHDAGVLFLVDAAQTAGAIPIDVAALGIDMLALPGHKALLGPTGTGALYIRDGLWPEPIMRGGTGSRSDLEIQPEFMPDRYESGTLNVAGLAGLAEGIRHVLKVGVARVAEHERALVERFLRGAAGIPGVQLHGPETLGERCGVVSFNLSGMPPSDVGMLLDQDYAIMSRVGLHCAPGAHRTMGTFPQGSVRFGFGLFNTETEVDASLDALSEIATWAQAETSAARGHHA